MEESFQIICKMFPLVLFLQCQNDTTTNLQTFLKLTTMTTKNFPQRTYKVTFFDKDMDVYEVKTYHNVISQGDLMRNVASRIYALDLMDKVKLYEGDTNYTQAANNILEYELKEIEQN